MVCKKFQVDGSAKWYIAGSEFIRPEVTFNNLEGQNHIAYSTSDPIRVCMPNIRLIHATVKPEFRHEHTDKQMDRHTDCTFIYIYVCMYIYNKCIELFTAY